MSPIQDAFLKFEQKKSAPQINDIHTTDCHFMGPSKFDDSKIFFVYNVPMKHRNYADNQNYSCILL